MEIRENMRQYTRSLMKEAHEKGTPVMRPLFYEFPDDKNCWEVEDEYLYGSKVLVAPILEKGAVSRNVYLPEGTEWFEADSGKKYLGGQWLEAPAPMESIPVFYRK